MATLIPILAPFALFAAESNPASPVKGTSAPLRLCVENSSWHLPPGTRIEGDTLLTEVRTDAAPGARDARASVEIDVSDAFAAMQCVAVTARVCGEGVSEPPHGWQGAKTQLAYTDFFGERVHREAVLPRGSFGWTNVTVRLSPLRAPRGIPGGRVRLSLGLENAAGRVAFDLASLRIDYEDTGIPRVKEDEDLQPRSADLQARSADLAPEGRLHAAQRRPPLRGCMLPQRATTEDDIETLRRWGATLVRFQIARDFGKIGANSDLAEYAAWVDSRLDNLAQVLDWCAARGMKVCVDLHATPGGIRAGDRDTAMLYEERLADAFVETWRRIAARCAPGVQTTCAPGVQTTCAPGVQTPGVLYGYDLVNEPQQTVFAPANYWELQRRAAEAVREIDPVTPIIVESNRSASPTAFAYLSPLAMENVIYQLHLYAPSAYTHQGVGSWPLAKDGRPLVWPDPSRGWNRDWLRRVLEPVREFQRRHGARIYVGEFSAIAWAPGAEAYLRDCIALFEEYGWDWTYHAFREWSAWSVEHEVASPGKSPVPSADNPRKRALLEGLKGR